MPSQGELDRCTQMLSQWCRGLAGAQHGADVGTSITCGSHALQGIPDRSRVRAPGAPVGSHFCVLEQRAPSSRAPTCWEVPCPNLKTRGWSLGEKGGGPRCTGAAWGGGPWAPGAAGSPSCTHRGTGSEEGYLAACTRAGEFAGPQLHMCSGDGSRFPFQGASSGACRCCLLVGDPSERARGWLFRSSAARPGDEPGGSLSRQRRSPLRTRLSRRESMPR